MKFKTITDKNRMIHLNMEAINAYCARWKPGTSIDISITRKKKTVSDPLRRYYWSIVLPIFLEAFGYNPDENELLHFFLKCKFFGIESDEHGIYRNVPSVFGNNSKEPIEVKQKFIAWLKRKSAEQGYYIPDPGE